MKKKYFWIILLFSVILSVLLYILVGIHTVDIPNPDAEQAPDKPTISLLTAFDAQEISCLAENIYYEARGESREGQIAVAQVTINRVTSGKFPRTICKVVHQKRQFSWTNHKTLFRTNATALDVAHEIYVQDMVFGHSNDPTNGALFYHANYVKPEWRKSFTHTATIGKHIFYRFK